MNSYDIEPILDGSPRYLRELWHPCEICLLKIDKNLRAAIADLHLPQEDCNPWPELVGSISRM
jgi:hypothetical protein